MSDSSVCVIGCGVTGILAVKYCLEYGLSVQCYELRPCLGGIWTGGDPSVPRSDSQGRELTCVHDAISLNTSQFVTTFSDFPLPDDLVKTNRYLDACRFLQYLQRYAAHFGIEKHVAFSTRVLRVARAASGCGRRWAVTVRRDEEGGADVTTLHDHVIVASGLYETPFSPEIPGLQETSVRCVHSAHVRSTKEQFEGKRVLVIGGSISAADIAEAAVKAGAKKVTWALTRSPKSRSVFMLARYPFGKHYAWDEWTSVFALSWIPAWLRLRVFQKALLALHETAPGVSVSIMQDRTVVANMDVMQEALDKGVLEILSTSISAFAGPGQAVRLCDGSEVEVDVCTFATGFTPLYAFLGRDVLGGGSLADLTLHRFLVALDKPAWGLIFAYTTSVTGSGVVASEMEMRWVAHQLASGQLTSEEERQQLCGRSGLNANVFATMCRRNVFEVVDDLAQDIGCHPHPFLTLLLSPSLRQRRLATAVAFGTWIPQHYRLRGPNAKPDLAEETILKMAERTTSWKFRLLTTALNLLYFCGGSSLGAFLLFKLCEQFVESDPLDLVIG